MRSIILLMTAPGPVSNLLAEPKFTSIMLTWSTPQEPNGIIISYEITYRVDGGDLIASNSTGLATSFIVPSLPPSTTVSDISVSAYTSIGQGEAARNSQVLIPGEPRPRKFL